MTAKGNVCEHCGHTKGEHIVGTFPCWRERGRCDCRHRHAWTYTTSISGWTIARCECGAEELA